MIAGSVVLELLANAYRDAALAGVDMRQAVGAIERARATVASKEACAALGALDDEVGRVDAGGLRVALMSLRGQLAKEAVAGVVDAIAPFSEGGGEEARSALAHALAPAVAWLRRDVWMGFTRSTEAPRLCRAVDGLVQATRLAALGRWGGSLALFELVAVDASVNAALRARSHLHAGAIELHYHARPTAAERRLAQARELAPGCARVLCFAGDLRLYAGDIPGARRTYLEALDAARRDGSDFASTDGATALGSLADVAISLGKLDEALQRLEEMTSLRPGESGGYRALIRATSDPAVHAQIGWRVSTLLDTAIAVEPEATADLLLVAAETVLRKKGDSVEGRSLLARAREADASSSASFVLEAKMMFDTDKTDEADASYERALEVDPRSFDALRGRGRVAVCKNDDDGARRFFAAALNAEPWQSIVIQGDLAELALERGDVASGFDAIRRLLADEPEAPPSFTLAQNPAVLGDPEMVALFQRSERGRRGMAEHWNRCGHEALKKGDPAGAVRAYERAAAICPDAVFCRNIAAAAGDSGDWLRARQEIDRARELDGDVDLWHVKLGYYDNAEGNWHYDSGRFRDAIACYERSALHLPGDAIVQANQARAWKNLADAEGGEAALEKAIDAMKRALDLAPNQADYARALAAMTARSRIWNRYGAGIMELRPSTTPIRIEIAADLVTVVASAEGSLLPEASQLIERTRQIVLHTMGFRMPAVRFVGVESGFRDGQYAIAIGGLAVSRGCAPAGWRFVLDGKAGGVPAIDPVTGRSGRWLRPEEVDSAESSGHSWTALGWIARDLEAVTRRHAADLFGHDELARTMKEKAPGHVARVRDAGPGALTALTIVLRALLAEQVPLVPLERLCEVFLREWRPGMQSLSPLLRTLRMVPEVRQRLPGNHPDAHRRVPLAPELERLLTEHVLTDGAEPVLALEHSAHLATLEQLRAPNGGGPTDAIVVRAHELRPLVEAMLRAAGETSISVLAEEETLSPALEVA